MTYREAQDKFNVPRSTLFGKLKFIYPLEAKKGSGTYLTKEEEDRILKWIIERCQKGSPVNKDGLLDSVKKLLDLSGRKTFFKNNRPGRSCFKLFMKRHKDLTIRTAQNLSRTRAFVEKKDVLAWFDKVKDYLISKNLFDIDPSRIFNLDESAFFLNPSPGKVLAKKGCNSVYKVAEGDDKESIRVLYSGSASGAMPSPLILYWYKRIPTAVKKRIPSGWCFGSTESGWMTSESFLSFIKNVFYPWLVENNIIFPVVVYLDGHASHVTLELSDFCSENDIEIVTLHGNSTHFLQPCDKSLFHPLKEAWKKAVNDWNAKYNKVTKEDFATVLKNATDSLNFKSIMENGFRACGLFPFNPDSIDYYGDN